MPKRQKIFKAFTKIGIKEELKARAAKIFNCDISKVTIKLKSTHNYNSFNQDEWIAEVEDAQKEAT